VLSSAAYQINNHGWHLNLLCHSCTRFPASKTCRASCLLVWPTCARQEALRPCSAMESVDQLGDLISDADQ